MGTGERIANVFASISNLAGFANRCNFPSKPQAKV